jgi:uncharacterized protein (TIGR02145 family)
VKLTPIAYKEAAYYDGITSVTIGYSKSDASEESTMNSVTTAVENTVTKSSSTNYSVSAGAFGVGISAGGEFTWEDSETRSTSNTHETTVTKISSETTTMEVTIGNNGQPTGKYRYSLFATTDVYYVLVLNRFDRTFKEDRIVVCARPGSATWATDYDPDLSGEFEKTAEGEPLEIPEVDYSTLPIPQPAHPFLGDISFQTDKTWEVGNQIWSDGVIATGCKKNSFNGGTSIGGPYKADCRQNPGYGDLFSWEAVNQYQAALCPDGWRVPTRSDVQTLYDSLGNDLRVYTSSRWGGQLGGNAGANGRGDLNNQGIGGSYWTQTADGPSFAYYLSYFDSGANVTNNNRTYGFSLRCVKDK